MNTAYKLAAIAVIAMTLQGCVPIIIEHSVMNSQDHQHYSDYVTKTNDLNFERQKAGFQPVAVMTFDEWKSGTS